MHKKGWVYLSGHDSLPNQPQKAGNTLNNFCFHDFLQLWKAIVPRMILVGCPTWYCYALIFVSAAYGRRHRVPSVYFTAFKLRRTLLMYGKSRTGRPRDVTRKFSFDDFLLSQTIQIKNQNESSLTSRSDKKTWKETTGSSFFSFGSCSCCSQRYSSWFHLFCC